jgi:hypothetical protein
MDDEQVTICKEAVVALFRYYPSTFLEGLRSITKNVSAPKFEPQNLPNASREHRPRRRESPKQINFLKTTA